MKKLIILYLFCLYSSLYAFNEYNDNASNVTYNKNKIEGYVYFNGFDFNGYKSESKGIISMLDSTYIELKKNYSTNKHPFVFVGHSQGGLRALAMSTYLKEKDPILYKQLRGIITLSGIDNGLSLLKGKGSEFRDKIQEDVSILSNGAYGAINAPSFTIINPDIVTNYLFSELIKYSTSNAIYDFGKNVLCDYMGGSEAYAYPILYDENWDNYAQIRDMCPNSSFIKKWIGSSIFQNKLDKNLNYIFIIGEKADTLEAAKSYVNIEEIKNGFENSANLFNTAKIIHIAKTITGLGLFTNSIKYASDCGKAYDWCNNYQDELNELIGNDINDGLVAASDQLINPLIIPSTIIEKPNDTHESIVQNTNTMKDVQSKVIEWMK